MNYKKWSNRIFYFIILFLFMGASFFLIYTSFQYFQGTFDSFLQIYLDSGFLIVIGLFFLGFSLYGIKEFLVSKQRKGKLIAINHQPHFDQLLFECEGSIYPYRIKAEENSLVLETTYLLSIQYLKIRKILKPASDEEDKQSYWSHFYMPDGTYFPYAITIIPYVIASLFSTGSLTILINISMHSLSPKELRNHLFACVICLLLFTWIVYIIIKDYQQKRRN